ncbi:class I adenylate cyclase [Pseudodesulfovibrio pelocollis]|uniref:class I adenylate cyclase n=1 Tax=Pseudodesulfovibrio pelocollis TaxID=3051432 RepID=UPI00255B2385|nr:class I adenylate cyclase [Pseudodesulfovibrio sp. SB368]
MNQHEPSIPSLAEAIRACRAAPLGGDTPDLVATASAFAEAMAGLGPDSDAEAAPVADAVLNLFRIARSSSDGSTLRACLLGMLAAGRFGRILSSRVITGMTVSLRELAAVVAPLPAPTRLALAHEMLRDMRTMPDKPLLSWLEALARPLGETDPAGLVPFLAELGEAGEPLAFPVRQVLAGGGFDKWIEARLSAGADSADLDRLCLALVALNSPELALSLARAMASGTIRPTATALRAVAALTEAGNRAVLDMFLKVLASRESGSGNAHLIGACLDGIIAQDTPATGRLMATIRLKKPAMRRAADSRVPLLGDTAHAAYLAALPDAHRAGAEADALAALQAMAPDFVEITSRAGTARRRTLTSQPTQSERVLSNGTDPAAACPKPGLMARLFGSRRKTLAGVLPGLRNIRHMDLACSRIEDQELDGRELTGLDLSDSTFARVVFLRVKMAGSRLTRSVFTGGSATGCAFTATDFSGADLTGVAFAKCTFTDCDFTGAALSGCTFADCRFRTCALGGAALLDTRLSLCVFTASALAGATLHGVRARSCRFEDTDFTATEFTACDMAGLEFIDCAIRAARLAGCTLYSVTMPGTTVAGCHVHASDIPHALFLGNRLDRLPEAADGFASVPPDALAEALTDTGDHGEPATLRDWARELTFMRRERSIQMANRKRLTRAMGRLAPEKRAYLHMLPHLLATDVFESRFGLDSVPPCEVWGYTPSLTAIELTRQFFPDIKPSGARARVRILAVYAMGSLGTVAQTAQSDIDCWVCFDSDVTPDAEAGLRRKLDALGLWAESEFGLEAHFFPMRMDDVRDNRFSSGDEESSGSAQALLLKEEFYRTAVRIAGKHLAWWVTPAGADRPAHDACVRAARRYPAMGRPRLEDFGHLAPVPPDEYFGGSLWQMVKAIHSPFKSVLKLGLLETYADPAASHLPLCDRIKRNLFMNRHGVRHTDPYAGLFSTLRTYYADLGDVGAARLLTEAFRLKANLRDIEFFLGSPARAEDTSLVTTLFGRECTEPERRCHAEVAWTFQKSLKMGGAVRDYMVSTYQRIQAGLSEGDRQDVRITPEDLTRMGRRIAANFSPKPHKVMRVPFMDAPGGGFAILHFSARKAPGKQTVWVTRGGSRAEAKKLSSALQVLHSGGDPAHMLAWLLANRLYTPRTLLQGDRTMAPISLADLQKLMPAMHEFFPFDQTFERDINEGLNPERVTRAFLLFNLMAGPDLKRIEQVSVIYSTNWGEMFCRTFRQPGPLLERQPSQFLAEALDHPVTDIPRMTQFIPKGSQCKRVNLI